MKEKGSFCTTSRGCYDYEEPARGTEISGRWSKADARQLAYKAADRNEPVQHCVERRRRNRTKRVCYVDGRKQPTNLTLLGTAAAVVGAYALTKK